MLWTSEQNEELSRYCVGIQAISTKVRLGHADYADAAALEFVLPQLAEAVSDLKKTHHQKLPGTRQQNPGGSRQ